jgi:CRISPR type III-B/RAMP module RAMP protein Cmr6
MIFLERAGGNARDPYRLGGIPSGDGNNSLIMLNRIAFFDARTGKLHDDGKRELIGWACRNHLGQDGALVGQVARRREQELRTLAAGPPARHYVRLHARPEWRLAIGLGDNANAYELGFALHGTYGWPVIPGSALKGLAAAWAAAAGVNPADVWRVLGGTRTDVPHPQAHSAEPGKRHKPEAARGTVSFLDAIPAGRPVIVEADVLTPHVKPYYDGTAAGKPVPPAEYHSPVPVTFLTVRGAYAVDVYGSSSDDVELAAEWLTKAGGELGAGAKTAAGYGYLSVHRDASGGPA